MLNVGQGTPGFPSGLAGKESACQCREARDAESIPEWEDGLEKEMATLFGILAWEILWIEEPGRPQPMGPQRVRHD